MNLEMLFNDEPSIIKIQDERGEYLDSLNRYVFVFELFKDEEIENCHEFYIYNAKIESFSENCSFCSLERADFVAFSVDSSARRFERFKNFIIGLSDGIEKVSDGKIKKRLYVLDLQEDNRLIFTCIIGKKSFRSEFGKLIDKVRDNFTTASADQEKKKYGIYEDDLISSLRLQKYVDTATVEVENINSTIADIPQAAKDMINIVCCDDETINSYSDVTVRLSNNRSFYRWLNFLLSQITVYLVREEDMPTMREYIAQSELKEDDVNEIVRQTTLSKALGCYYGAPKRIGRKDARIVICPELIERFAESVGIDKNVAYAKVVVHEFAHAMMDERNVLPLCNDENGLEHNLFKRLSFRNPLFRFVMEESVANCITLQRFHSSSLGNAYVIYKDIYRFIENQPKAYRLGVSQFDAKINVCKWRALKDQISSGIAQEWLDKYYVGDDKYSTVAFDDLFEPPQKYKKSKHENILQLEDSHGLWILDLDDLAYVESDRNYTDFHLVSGKTKSYIITLTKVWEEIEDICSYEKSNFRRVGRSYIINLAYVRYVDSKNKKVFLKDEDGTALHCSKSALDGLIEHLKKKEKNKLLKKVKPLYAVEAVSYEELCNEIIDVDGNQCVDLGLPSGVKWATENLYGSLSMVPYMFAWGETRPKQSGDYLLGKWNSMTKYNDMDELIKLLPEDDAATRILGKKWRTPTKEEFQELMDLCRWSWCTWDSFYGALVTGPNGNSIFLQAAGYTRGREAGGFINGIQGNYWTSSLSEEDENYAYCCSFVHSLEEGQDICFLDDNAERDKGFFIRPVTD